MKHIGLFAAGVLFGTAGLKLLGSKDAKKVYADAKDINAKRAEAEAAAVIEDAPVEEA